MSALVPADFDPPASLDHPRFRLRPLGPEHNDSDYAAWMSSIDHIRRTPGFADWSWPQPMTIEENLRDLVKHADDYTARRGFTYTVLAPSAPAVIGCVYIYPSEDPSYDVRIRSWVRAEDADLDPILYAAVTGWMAVAWPFERVGYAPRIPPGS